MKSAIIGFYATTRTGARVYIVGETSTGDAVVMERGGATVTLPVRALSRIRSTP